jgi:hypothetical protein
VLPGHDFRAIEVAPTLRPDGEKRPPHAHGRVDDSAGGDGARDRSIASETGEPPLSRARPRLVSVEPAAPQHHQVDSAGALDEDRRRVGIARLRRRPRHPLRLPALFAGPLVVRDDVARRELLLKISERVLQADRNDEVSMDDGAVRVSPPDGVAAVVLLEVALPFELTVEPVGCQCPLAEMHDDALAVGHRRWAGEIVVPVEFLTSPLLHGLEPQLHSRRFALRDFAHPGDAPRLRVDTHEEEISAGVARHEEGVADHGRGAGAPLRQGADPRNAGRAALCRLRALFARTAHAPCGRQPSLIAHAVSAGSSPLRPVGGRDFRAEQQQDHENKTSGADRDVRMHTGKTPG